MCTTRETPNGNQHCALHVQLQGFNQYDSPCYKKRTLVAKPTNHNPAITRSRKSYLTMKLNPQTINNRNGLVPRRKGGSEQSMSDHWLRHTL